MIRYNNFFGIRHLLFPKVRIVENLTGDCNLYEFQNVVAYTVYNRNARCENYAKTNRLIARFFILLLLLLLL
jgi:hypothetical protein